jgi:signal transduction histidine kinase
MRSANPFGRRSEGGVVVPPVSRSVSERAKPRRPLVGAAGGLLFAALQAAWGQTADSLPLASRVLSNFAEVWTMPQEERAWPHRIRTEVVIYYFDAEWNSAWGECQKTPTFLPLGDCPTPLKPGQRVAVDGVFLPVQERVVWDKTQIRILEEGVEREAEVVRSLSDNPAGLKARLALVEGLIDSQKVGPTHVTLNFLVNGTTATAYVLRDTNGTLPHFKAGDFVRMKCVYAPQLDQNNRLENLDLWVARTTDVEVRGSLSADPRFAIPPTPIDEIQEGLSTNDVICVHGTVRKHEAGKWVVIWDATGQVTLQSRQTQPLDLGDRVEAIGYPSVSGVQQSLVNGFYRLSPATNATAVAGVSERPRLRIAEQIRELTRKEAAGALPVTLRALVTWAHAGTPFAYVQDGSGGIRVMNPKWDSEETSKPGTIVLLEGTTCQGDFVPVVTNAVLRRVGWRNLNAEQGQLVTLEQALTGLEEGRWVEMYGYVRAVTDRQGLRHFALTTSSGEFEAWVPSSRTLKSFEGSIVRVQGVCAASANARHQMTGIQIWIPESRYILVEEPEPADAFAVPSRPLDSLRRFSIDSGLHRRIRTSGAVVLHAPGRYLYVQDGADAVLALSRQLDPLQPGDRVEVVGFPGNQGRRVLLREAIYRRVGSGKQPAPVPISAGPLVNLEVEGLLARAEGILLNATEKNGEARLLIHARDSAFEVSLDATAADVSKQLQALEPGSRLAVTGVYEVQSDEYGNARSFLLRLRSWNDVRLLQRPPWWTLARLLRVLLGVMLVSVMALAWGVLIARKNRLLRQTQAQLKTANDRLEQRVEERTGELRLQVAAKERARAELAEAQENLMLTSRQAGMAEVATGVLHNVGNVLNSVNVSSSVLTKRLQCCPLESVAKAAALLQKNQDQIAAFLAQDPKGRALPEYLQRLGQVLLEDKREMQSEIEQLSKNIDHIKIIVAMQQSYARLGGVLEELDPKDLLEDAIQINNASFERDEIQLFRDYQTVPPVMVDRHKVLQILVNLLSNAKHALREKPSDRTLTLSLSAPGPDRVHIAVSDNGAGIGPENLSRIFSQGFTTRKDGHGFGLHSGAIAAKELGGSLAVHSEGIGRGATFTLQLPTAAAPPQTPLPEPGLSTPLTPPESGRSPHSPPEVGRRPAR